MSKLILVIKENILNFILAITLLIILTMLVALQIIDINNSEYISKINPGYGYYSGPSVEDLKKEPGITTISTPRFDTDLSEEVFPDTTNDLVTDLTKINYKLAPDELLAVNMGELQSGKNAQQYKLLNIPYPKEISNFAIPLDTFDTKPIYAGTYPSSEDEVMLPINYALQYTSDNGLKSYKDIIGKDITYTYLDNKVTKSISGIIGGETIIGVDHNYVPEQSGDAIIIKYDTESQLKSLEDKYGIDILSASDISAKIPMYIKGEWILVLVMYYVMLRKNIKQTIEFLNFHSYNKLNIGYPIITVGLPIIILLIMMIKFL